MPGLHVSLSSTRFSPIYVIRGIYTDRNPQVLMLVNGVPITQLFFGDRGGRNTLPVESIARIEIIRGPGSALYGADAFAGVINVITKTAGDIQGTEAGVRAGSFHSRWAWLLHGGRWKGLDIAFTFEWMDTDGDRDRIIDKDAQSFFDEAFGTHASLAPGPADTRIERLDTHLDIARGDWRFHLWNWRQIDGGTGPGLSLALDPSGRGDTDNYLAALTFHPDGTGDWDIKARLSYMDIDGTSRQRLFPPGAVLPIGADGNVNPLNPVAFIAFPDGLKGNPAVFEQHARLDLRAIYQGFERHTLHFGAGAGYGKERPKESKNFGPGVLTPPFPSAVGGEVTDVTGTPFVFLKEKSRTLFYALVQDEWRFARDWELTAGGRYDRYSDFGDTFNPRLALVWQTDYNLTSKLLYGRAFRAPSFAELFSTNNPAGVGNPELKPETIDTLELAFDYRPTFDLDTHLNLFTYRIDNLIDFVPEPDGFANRAQNIGKRRGYGLELAWTWKAARHLKLKGNYAYQRSIDERTDHDAGNAPHHQFYLRGDWHFLPDWHLDAQFKAISERKRVAGDPRPDLGGYAWVDLTLRRTDPKERFELALSARNLFDTKAKEPSPFNPTVPEGSLIPHDFPLPGRSLYGEIRLRF
ncbi:MAG: TonB-dependent receptor [Gammaproteobacteria bacterium]|nr:MAG: TonB-dependent receptor [Gammaproteobacteria bacterium]